MRKPLFQDAKVEGSNFYGYLHQDQLGGSLALFWAIRLDLEEVSFEGGHASISNLMAEWLSFPVRDWRELENTRTSAATSTSGEASFYVGRHIECPVFELVIQERDGARFLVQVTVENDDYTLSKSAWVTFSGIKIQRDSLFPKPCSAADVRRMLKPLLDVDGFGDAVQEGRRFMVAPRV